MSNQEITLDVLARALLESAGADEHTELNNEVMDVDFDELGYDSLALLETAARLERDHGIELDDDAATSAKTPRELLELANSAHSAGS
ncbi:MAG TPA: acyl carrier protein [Streptosporangiaceae bacterium]|nr:acyl carrier protein [Streptosporangiaceae bacterium]